METFAQILSIFGMIFLILSFQFRSQRSILWAQLIGCLLFSVSYYMLGALIGALLNAINVIKDAFFLFCRKIRSDHPAILITIVVIAFAIYVLNFTVFNTPPTLRNFIFEILPAVAVTCSTIGIMKKEARFIRRMNLLISPCWLVYNIVNFSIGGILCELFSFTSTVIGIIRLDLKKKSVENNDEKIKE